MSGFHIDAFFEEISKENTQRNQMNTHDKIELPPLPTPPSLIQRKDWYGAIQAYARSYGMECARAAIEADRKRKGEVVVTKTSEGEIIAVTRQDDEGRILSVIAETDSKRGVEPVGYFYPWELERSLKAYPNGFPGAVAVYAAPQPAEPVKVPSMIDHAEPEVEGE